MEDRHNSHEFFKKLNTNEFYNSVSRPIIIADNLRTPENLGSVLRLAANIGALKALFISDTAYKFKNYKINKTASGAADKTSWRIINLEQISREIPVDYALVSLETTEQSGNVFEFDFPEKIAIVIGNEVSGIRQKLLDKSAYKLYIPIPGAISSLNASHALSVALFEWYRQMVKKS